MKIYELWALDYDKLSDMRMRALVKLSSTDCPEYERVVLRRICEIWKLRSITEIV